tara:strand:- start:1445 stop:1633 length:189 start_codon:yes stop_codon:yes gene_type:complete
MGGFGIAYFIILILLLVGILWVIGLLGALGGPDSAIVIVPAFFVWLGIFVSTIGMIVSHWNC